MQQLFSSLCHMVYTILVQFVVLNMFFGGAPLLFGLSAIGISAVIGFTATTVSATVHGHHLDNPIMPRVPNCNSTKAILTLKRKSNKKIFLCAMFKDEEGFLAEYVAYYKVHGFDHIILWNGNSRDAYESELAPWISTGFVEVRDVASLRDLPRIQQTKHYKDHYFRVIALQKEVERQCISWGIRNGYDYYLTSDLDEYVVPFSNRGVEEDHGAVAIVDVLDELFAETNARLAQTVYKTKEQLEADGIIYYPNATIHDINSKTQPQPTISQIALAMIKYNYAAAPHIQEPVDLLMLEAYLTRYEQIGYMNYYMSTQPKYVYRLSGRDIESIRQDGREDNYIDYFREKKADDDEKLKSFTDAQLWMSNCCFIHGCEFHPNPHKNPICGGRSAAWMSQSPLRRKDLKNKPTPKWWLRLNHYSRSVEKFAIKQLSWTETVNSFSNNAYLHRGYSTTYDPVALVYSCLVRAEINRARHEYEEHRVDGKSKSTGDISSNIGGDNNSLRKVPSSFEFLRQGKYWSRNPEVGRERHVKLLTDIYNISTPGLIFPYNPSSYKSITAMATAFSDVADNHQQQQLNNNLFIEYYGL